MSDNKLVATQSSSLVDSSTLIPLEAEQVEILEQLTHDKQRDLHRLELGVEQAFIQAGKALAQLRARRLYRSTHKTFEAYCQDMFGFTRRPERLFNCWCLCGRKFATNENESFSK